MILLLSDSVFFFLSCNFSALIPLSEVSDAAVMKKYGVKPDAETLDIANTAARKKSVSFLFLFPFLDGSFFKVNTICVAARIVHKPCLQSISNHSHFQETINYLSNDSQNYKVKVYDSSNCG